MYVTDTPEVLVTNARPSTNAPRSKTASRAHCAVLNGRLSAWNLGGRIHMNAQERPCLCSSSGKGPRGKTETLARCLSPPHACPPLAGGLVAVVVPRVRRADCPLSSGCCATATAAYLPRAPEWSTAALCGGRKLQRADVGCLLSAVSPVTTFSRLLERVGGGAHRASEGSWSSRTSTPGKTL